MFDGIDEALRAIASSGVRLALVSSNSEQNVLSVLGGSADLLCERACGVSLFGKAGRLRRLLRRCGVDSSRSILVGDELRDAQAARSAGMAFGAVAWGFNRPDVLRAERPEEWFETARDLGALMS
jgi:phosphoglycolate phosphatase